MSKNDTVRRFLLSIFETPLHSICQLLASDLSKWTWLFQTPPALSAVQQSRENKFTDTTDEGFQFAEHDKCFVLVSVHVFI